MRRRRCCLDGSGGGGGLSDGEIAGIAVGTAVGGSLLLLGIVAAGAIIAYKVIHKDDKYNNSAAEKPVSDRPVSERPNRRRPTLWQMLTNRGVDVYNPESKNPHQSITARAPNVSV